MNYFFYKVEFNFIFFQLGSFLCWHYLLNNPLLLLFSYKKSCVFWDSLFCSTDLFAYEHTFNFNYSSGKANPYLLFSFIKICLSILRNICFLVNSEGFIYFFQTSIMIKTEITLNLNLNFWQIVIFIISDLFIKECGKTLFVNKDLILYLSINFMFSSYRFCSLKIFYLQVFNSFFCVIYLLDPTSTIMFNNNRSCIPPTLFLVFIEITLLVLDK